MFDVQDRLVRQAINIAVEKAMDDMRGNLKRSIRNLIDLGLLFAQSDNQKWFFETARQVIRNPKNPYGRLMKRLMEEADNETIRRVGVNIGYSSLIYGSKKLRKKQEAMHVRLPWLLILDSVDQGVEHLDGLLDEGQEAGIYSYVLSIADAGALPALIRIVRKFGDCAFMLKLSAGQIGEKAAQLISEAHNVMVAVELEGKEEWASRAFACLRDKRCLYGYALSYDDENGEDVSSEAYIADKIQSGCLFGAYVAMAETSQRMRDAVYDFACRVRGKSGQPLIPIDWQRDVDDISEKLGLRSVLELNLPNCSATDERENGIWPLVELIRKAQLCVI